MKLGPLRQNARFRIKNVCTPDFAPGAIKLAAHVASHGADPMLLPFGRGAAWKEALRSAAVLSSVALDILKKVAVVGRACSHAALSLRVKLFIITIFHFRFCRPSRQRRAQCGEILATERHRHLPSRAGHPAPREGKRVQQLQRRAVYRGSRSWRPPSGGVSAISAACDFVAWRVPRQTWPRQPC